MKKNVKSLSSCLNKGAAVFLILTFLLQAGCAIRHARRNPVRAKPGAPPPYVKKPHMLPATRYILDGRVFRHGIVKIADNKIEKGFSGSKSPGLWITPGNMFYLVFVAIPVAVSARVLMFSYEFPLSFASDHLMIPFDLYRYNAARQQGFEEEVPGEK